MRRLVKAFLLLVLAWGILAWVGARWLVVNAPLASADAIVIMSGSSTYVERTQKAAEFYRQGRAPFVVLTNDDTRGGWSSAQQRNPYFVERARDELIKEGVPVEKIRMAPGIASSTHDESMLLKDYVSQQRFRSILVVTSAYHSRRALRSLRQSFAGTNTIIGLEPVPAGVQTPEPALWWLHREGWRSVGAEYVKLLYYWLKYG